MTPDGEQDRPVVKTISTRHPPHPPTSLTVRLLAGVPACVLALLPHQDFVVSDGEGRTASPEVTGLIVHVLERRHGCSVGVNSPYKGGFLVHTHGRAGAVGVQSVQVEVNRALYMDEQAVALKPQGWARLQAVVADLAHVLATDMPRHPPPESQ